MSEIIPFFLLVWAQEDLFNLSPNKAQIAGAADSGVGLQLQKKLFGSNDIVCFMVLFLLTK